MKVLGAIGCALLLAATAGGCGGAAHTGTGGKQRSTGEVRTARAAAADPVLARLGLPPVHGSSPLPGYLMIADRDNNRIIIVSPDKQIVWRFPAPGALRPGAGVRRARRRVPVGEPARHRHQ